MPDDLFLVRNVQAGRLTLHGWHDVIEDGEVHLFDVKAGTFIPASNAEHAGTGPYAGYQEPAANSATESLPPCP